MKDTILGQNHTINCKGKLLNLSHPIVMGIINITPDSFYDGGKDHQIEDALNAAEKHISEGASIIDIGGYSSRPGAKEISEEEELKRTIPTIKEISNNFPKVIISIDTFRSRVAYEAINSGASIINDISAGNLDTKMFAVVSEINCPYIMMHMQNTPSNMQDNPNYNNVVLDVAKFFSAKLQKLNLLGVSDVILDPGFGFGKTIQQNFDLLRELSHFNIFGHPILAGISRKSMLYKTLNTTPQEALNATTAAHMIALQQGANILRVHDVKEAIECIKIYDSVYH